MKLALSLLSEMHNEKYNKSIISRSVPYISQWGIEEKGDIKPYAYHLNKTITKTKTTPSKLKLLMGALIV